MQVITHSKHGGNISTPERWASVIAGGALAAFGIGKRSAGGILLAAVGGEFIRRGVTGHSLAYEALGIRTAPKGQGADTTSVPYELGVRVEKAVTVGKPREEVYRFWRNIENLPRFMKHVVAVKDMGDNRSRWVATAPGGRTVEWDAIIHNEIPNELIAWRSLPGADVQNAGAVLFKDAPGGRGTEVHVELQYNPPAGILGAAAAKLWGEEPTQQIEEDLHRFKAVMEAGEYPTTEGQPSGRAIKDGREHHHEKQREVQSASEQSFPASDAPAYNY